MKGDVGNGDKVVRRKQKPPSVGACAYPDSRYKIARVQSITTAA